MQARRQSIFQSGRLRKFPLEVRLQKSNSSLNPILFPMALPPTPHSQSEDHHLYKSKAHDFCPDCRKMRRPRRHSRRNSKRKRRNRESNNSSNNDSGIDDVHGCCCGGGGGGGDFLMEDSLNNDSAVGNSNRNRFNRCNDVVIL